MNFGVLIDKYDGQLSNLLTEWKSKFSEFKRFQSSKDKYLWLKFGVLTLPFLDPVYLFRCKLLP